MRDTLKALLPDITDKQLMQFETYYEMLVDWNTRVNLTAITARDDVIKKHFYDSLLALPLLEQDARCIDVGTGAGFPGVPLLIARPDLQMTLLDSLNKRLTFLEALIEKLGLSATLVHARAEDAGQDAKYRGRFDAAFSRAVSQLPALVELTVPFLKLGGSASPIKATPRRNCALRKTPQSSLNAS